MKTVGEFLTECGSRLAPFERHRVGRVGCLVSLTAITGACVAIALGAWDTGGSWASGFRFVVVAALATVILLFVGYAIVETMVEAAVRRRLREYVKESGSDLETLAKAAELRSAHIAGGRRLVALLRQEAGGR